jgi:hypothetical protein
MLSDHALRRFRDCGRGALSHGAQPDLSDESLARRVARAASCDERNFLLLLDGVKAAIRFSRSTCLAARCCVRRAGRQRVARIHPDAADASSASLSTRSTLRGMGLRIVEPRASEICFALQSCRLPALLTMLTIDEACSSSGTFV